MYKLHFIQVNEIIGGNVILPLSAGLLWETAKLNPAVASNWTLNKIVYKKVVEESEYNTLINELATGDIICISNYTWNSAYHLSLVKDVKQINPGIFVIAGGPNVTPDIPGFWKNYSHIVDLAIVGEGEEGLTSLLSNWPHYDINTIDGAWTPMYYKGRAQRVKTIGYAGSPYLNGLFDSIVQHEQEQGHNIQAIVQTNRGCPYLCTFCDEGMSFKSKMFFYDEQRIRDEILWCAKQKVAFLSFADSNWGITDRDVELVRYIRDLKLEYGYPEVLDATYAKNAADRLLQMAEIDMEHNTNLIRGFTVALQSMNPQTLKAIKRFNLDYTKQKRLIEGFKQHRVPTYTEIIWPLPYEDYDSFISTLDQTIELGLDNWLGVYPLSIEPGTELFIDFRDDYTYVKQQAANANRDTVVEHEVYVNGSRWADRATVIRGQVLYAWLASLYFYGFARPVLERIANDHQTSIVNVAAKFVDFTNTNLNTTVSQYSKKVRNWWAQWYKGMQPDSLSIFHDHDTMHWSPYTHLASWIQSDLDKFYKELDMFAKEYGITNTKEMCIDGIVQYNVEYPYTSNNKTVKLKHDPVKFANLYEFSRYYFWWKRKNGWHKTEII